MTLFNSQSINQIYVMPTIIKECEVPVDHINNQVFTHYGCVINGHTFSKML